MKTTITIQPGEHRTGRPTIMRSVLDCFIFHSCGLQHNILISGLTKEDLLGLRDDINTVLFAPEVIEPNGVLRQELDYLENNPFDSCPTTQN